MSALKKPAAQPMAPQLMTITPAIATEWLEKYGNVHNREISDARVKLYADQMKIGKWVVTGETVAFDVNGILVNGHHRLWACINANTSFETYVVYGVAIDAFLNTDIGYVRTAGHMIHMGNKDIRSPRTVGAAVGFVMLYDAGMKRNKAPTKAEVAGFALANTALVSLVTRATRAKGLVKVAAPVAATCFLASRRYSVKAQEFMDEFVTGADLPHGHPVLALRTRYFAEQSRLNQTERFAFAAFAWNAYAEERKITRLQMFKDADGFPRIKGAG